MLQAIRLIPTVSSGTTGRDDEPQLGQEECIHADESGEKCFFFTSFYLPD